MEQKIFRILISERIDLLMNLVGLNITEALICSKITRKRFYSIRKCQTNITALEYINFVNEIIKLLQISETEKMIFFQQCCKFHSNKYFNNLHFIKRMNDAG